MSTLITNKSTNRLIKDFRQRLLDWGVDNTREYPWRWVDDPYRVLLSEFMLHRTQVKQVIAVYDRFLEQYPTLEDFSRAEEIQLWTYLESLGLHWRINGMVKALSQLWTQYRKVPADREILMSIEGIGQYIAGATVCFTRNEPIAIIDTNTVRVVGRVNGLDLHGEARRRKPIVDAIAHMCEPKRPRDYYYAMIDLAHQVCMPKNPDCKNCPLFTLPCKFGVNYVSQMEM